MKKTLSLVLILSMLICSSFSVFAAESTANESQSALTTFTTDSSTPWIVHTYTKTVTKTYSKQSSIPESISYEEYNNTLKAWFSGTLYLKSTKKTASGWQATFSGTLTGRI